MSFLLGDKPIQSAFPWLTQNLITQRFGQNGETGIDIGMAMDTPITSPVAGKVVGVGVDPTGAYLGIETSLAGQRVALYIQHLDQTVVAKGESVKPGTLLGYSGGQLSGGVHPASPKYSTGPHIEIGFNAPWGSGRNPNHLGPNFDPLPALQALAQGGVPSGVAGISGNVVQSTTTNGGFLPIAIAIDHAEQFEHMTATNLWDTFPHNWGAFSLRASILVIGVVLILGVFSYLLRRPAETIVQIGKDLAPAAAVVAA